MSIERYERELNRARAEWRANWALPLGSAYANAYARFLNTLQDQTKADQLKAQLAVMALTMGIGGGLGALFGKTTLSSVAVDQALTTVCNRNMVRTFNAMAAADASPAARFLLGQAWDNASTLLTTATKQQLTGLVGSTPPARTLAYTHPNQLLDAESQRSLSVRLSARNLVANPQVAQNNMDAYIERIYAACLRSLSDIQDNSPVMLLDVHIEELRDAPFLQSPRSSVLTEQVGGVLRAELEMELAMYMVLVMSCDYQVNGTASSSGGVTASHSERTRDITVGTRSASYPPDWSRNRIDCSLSIAGLCISGDTYREYQEVRYRSLGSTITARIEALYQVLIDPSGSFFRGAMGRHEIRRAERASDKINRRYASGLGTAARPAPVLVPGN